MTGRNRFRTRRQRHAAGTSDDVTFGPILEPRHYTIRHLAVRDATTTPTGAITLLVAGHGPDYLIDEVPAPAAGRLYVFTDEIWLEPGETLIARVVGATAADLLELYLEGDWWAGERGDADRQEG